MTGMIDPFAAPNFKGNYPLAGELIGPAWRDAWRTMADGQWHAAPEIIDAMCYRQRIVKITAVNLLRSARRAGVLEVRRPVNSNGGNAPAQYRIK